MKRKSCVYINEDLAGRLGAAADQLGVTKSGLVAAALHRFLDATERREAPPSFEQELAGMRRQLEHLDHELKIVGETAAMHARYHLAVTPPIPEAAQRSACSIGAARFDEFAAQIGRRVHDGRPLIRETLERLVMTDPDIFSSEEVIPAELPSTRHDPVPHAALHDKTTDTRHTPVRPAAVREGGSDGAFPEPPSYRPHSTLRRQP